MIEERRSVAVTGAYGYLGSRIRAVLEDRGWVTHALVRRPRENDRASVWNLGMSTLPDEVASFGALVHCAYDFQPRRRVDIWRTNVAGSAGLLRAAHAAGMRRIVVISSMSAYEGTRQLYGQSKLAIEVLALGVGGVAIRPGLVYGAESGGMVGRLLRAAQFPVVPLIGANSLQHPVRDDDIARVVALVLESSDWHPEVFGVAQREAMSFRDILKVLAAREGARPRFVPLPWQAAYAGLRLAEAVGIPAPFRADSVLGLVRPAQVIAPSRAFPGMLDGLAALDPS